MWITLNTDIEALELCLYTAVQWKFALFTVTTLLFTVFSNSKIGAHEFTIDILLIIVCLLSFVCQK